MKTKQTLFAEEASDQRDTVLVAGNEVSVHQSVEGEGNPQASEDEKQKPVITRVSRKGNPQASRVRI